MFVWSSRQRETRFVKLERQPSIISAVALFFGNIVVATQQQPLVVLLLDVAVPDSVVWQNRNG